ncbi:hypothetical protein PR001_g30539, partial [Phytophthora rubi]
MQAPEPPPDYPKEVIDVATPTPPDTEEEDKDDVHMEE